MCTHVAVIEHLVHVDALCVENRLLLSSLGCGFTEKAACQAFGFHDDGVLGQRCQDRRQVEVHLAHRQSQINLRGEHTMVFFLTHSNLTKLNQEPHTLHRIIIHHKMKIEMKMKMVTGLCFIYGVFLKGLKIYKLCSSRRVK